ncbi:MAG: RNA polymerase sigma factor [Myxococcota bacterium]|nr:sigma-70 family RNA polymerase sigma factor [Myxococcota bacterium]
MSCILSEDRALLDRFRGGERDALTVVFTHYAPHVASLLKSGFGFSAGGQRVRFGGYKRVFELEDALQEVFKRAFSERARMSYDGLRPYAAYMAVIARNLVIDQYASRRRELLHFNFEDSTTANDDDSPAPGGRPERELLASELRGVIDDFRAKLDEREQTIFKLRFEENLSHAGITERTGLTASQVKTTEAKLRGALMRHLRKHGYLDERAAHVTPAAEVAPSGEHR